MKSFCLKLAWILFCFESPSWLRLRAKADSFFPHLVNQPFRLGDPLRYLIQLVWLVLVKNPSGNSPTWLTYWHSLKRIVRAQLDSFIQWTDSQHKSQWVSATEEKMEHFIQRRGLMYSVTGVLILGFVFLITVHLTSADQLILTLVMVSFGAILRLIPGQISIIALMLFSIFCSFRYLWWRCTTTINWDNTLDLSFALMLVFAEIYAIVVLLLGYAQTVWPLNRQPTALPDSPALWPTIDWMIPTYNEPLSVIQPSIYATLGINWPKDKLNIYLLDDGNSPEKRAFAKEVGIHYIARSKHEHAKAGNINYALKHTHGDLVVVFDCDHIPSHYFLQWTVAWFLREPSLAILQTPHHFYSPDPFERNLNHFREIPSEGMLFYGVIQDGNDTWDATFFCGSCGILRRSALEKIGGMAVETVTEDSHTSLRLQRQGYTSAYIRIPMAAGVAPQTLNDHIHQRMRWARGMSQIFRLDNPLLGKGLSFMQRLCYTNAMLHFMSGIPRLIFLVAPLAFLYFHAYIIYAPALIIFIYLIPHLYLSMITNVIIQGKYRYMFWGEIYETVLAWYMTAATTMALIFPHGGDFNVTPKGGVVGQRYADWMTGRPYIGLWVANGVGLLLGLGRLYFGPANEQLTVIFNLFWVLFNLIIVSVAMALVYEARQLRSNPRIEWEISAALVSSDGHAYPCMLVDFSMDSVGIKMDNPGLLKNNEAISLILTRSMPYGQSEYSFPAQVVRIDKQHIGLRFQKLTLLQSVNYVRCTFGRSDLWALWQTNFKQDRPIKNIGKLLSEGLTMYFRLVKERYSWIRALSHMGAYLTSWVISFIPRNQR
jgi:cellulose synthase (UDP-forming)